MTDPDTSPDLSRIADARSDESTAGLPAMFAGLRDLCSGTPIPAGQGDSPELDEVRSSSSSVSRNSAMLLAALEAKVQRRIAARDAERLRAQLIQSELRQAEDDAAIAELEEQIRSHNSDATPRSIASVSRNSSRGIPSPGPEQNTLGGLLTFIGVDEEDRTLRSYAAGRAAAPDLMNGLMDSPFMQEITSVP